jgi:O-antigen/teichoic acid export membrane protein
VLSSWAVTAANIGYVFLVTPIVVRTLGQEGYGVWSFLNGLLGYTNLLFLGVGSALVRYVAAFSATGDQPSINRLTSVATTIFAAIGLSAVVVFAGLSLVVEDLFADGLTMVSSSAAAWTCAMLGVQVFCFFLATSFNATLVGRDRYDLANLSRIVSVVLRFVLVTLALSGDRPLIRLAVLTTIASFIDVVVVMRLAHRLDPHLSVRVARPRLDELRLLYGFGAPAFVIVLSSRLISYTDTTVIGMMLGASDVALYAVPLQLVEYAQLAFGAYAGVLLSRLSVLNTLGAIEEMRAAYGTALRITALLAAFVLTNLLWAGPAFVDLWLGPSYGAASRWVLVWLVAAAFLHVFTTAVAMPFYHALKLLARPAQVLLIEALLNLVLSVLLVRRLGISGVALATFLPACVSAVILPRILARSLTVSAGTNVLRAAVPALALALAVSVVHAALGGFALHSYSSIAIRIVATVPAAAAVSVVVAGREDRNAVRRRASRLMDALRNRGRGGR